MCGLVGEGRFKLLSLKESGRVKPELLLSNHINLRLIREKKRPRVLGRRWKRTRWKNLRLKNLGGKPA